MRWWVTVGFSATLLGCGPKVGEVDGTGAGSDGGDGDTGTGLSSASGQMTTSPPMPPPPSTSTSTTGPDPTATVTDTNADGSDDSGSFLIPCDCPGITDPCDVWSQDCGPGDKCVPWANDGGQIWNSARCVPVEPDAAAVGEPCTMQGSAVSGVDDCAFGSVCLVDDLDGLTGVCVAQCTGSEQSPQCAAGSTCLVANDGYVTLCLDYCDPLARDCAAGGCIPIDASALVCAPVGPFGGIEPGTACADTLDCIETSQCVPAADVPGCFDPTCCTSHCDLSIPDPNSFCMPGQDCVPWYAPGTAPDGFDHVGICRAP